VFMLHFRLYFTVSVWMVISFELSSGGPCFVLFIPPGMDGFFGLVGV
jgi:hypothetical protein